MLWFQALSSRRFQRGFDRVNLHRPTTGMAGLWLYTAAVRVAAPVALVGRVAEVCPWAAAAAAVAAAAAAAAAAATLPPPPATRVAPHCCLHLNFISRDFLKLFRPMSTRYCSRSPEDMALLL